MRYMTLAAFTGAIVLAVGCGGKATENCVKMIECDAALAAADVGWTATWDGLDDAAYGNGGSCYKGDKDACDAACVSAVEGYNTAAEAYVTAGTLDAVPAECE